MAILPWKCGGGDGWQRVSICCLVLCGIPAHRIMGTIRFLVLVCGIPVHRVISPTGPNLLLVFSLSLSLSSALTVDIQHLPCYFPSRYFLMGLFLDGFVWQFSFRFWADILLSQFSSSHRYLLLTLGSRDSLCKSVWAAHFPSSQSSSSSSSSLTFCCCGFPLITGWIGSLGSKARLSEEFFFTFCCFLQLADHSPILDFLDLFSSPFRSSRRSAIVPGSSAQRPLRRVQCKKRPFR